MPSCCTAVHFPGAEGSFAYSSPFSPLKIFWKIWSRDDDEQRTRRHDRPQTAAFELFCFQWNCRCKLDIVAEKCFNDSTVAMRFLFFGCSIWRLAERISLMQRCQFVFNYLLVLFVGWFHLSAHGSIALDEFYLGSFDSDPIGSKGRPPISRESRGQRGVLSVTSGLLWPEITLF